MNRRSILKLIGAAPVAAPVVAREGAKAAGVSEFGWGPAYSLSGAPDTGSPVNVSGDHWQWLRKQVADALSGKHDADIIQEVMQGSVSVLDPDLAGSRSLSLSAAIRIQKERNIERRIRNNRERWLSSFKRETGMDWIP